MDKSNESRHGKVQKAGGEKVPFHLPRDINSRIWLLNKLKALRNECPTKVVRPFQSEDDPKNKEKSLPTTLPVSLPLKYYNNAQSNKNASLLKQNSSTSETGNVYYNSDHNVNLSLPVIDLSPNDMDTSNDAIYKELERMDGGHKTDASLNTIQSHGTNDRNKTKTKDHSNSASFSSNSAGYYSSQENIIVTCRDKTGSIRQREQNTTDTISASVSKSNVQISGQRYTETIHDNSSIVDDNTANLLRNVRKNYPQTKQTPSKHNLPLPTLPERPKYNLSQTNTAALPYQSSINTSNNSALQMNTRIQYQETRYPIVALNKETQTVIVGQNQSTQTENETKNKETQTDNIFEIAEEQNKILEFILSNDIKLEDLQMFIKSRDHNIDNATAHEKNAEKLNVEMSTDDNNDTSGGIITPETVENSERYKVTFVVLRDVLCSDGFKNIPGYENDPRLFMFHKILQYLVFICKFLKLVHPHLDLDFDGDVEIKSKKTNNANDEVVNEQQTSTADSRKQTSTADSRKQTSTADSRKQTSTADSRKQTAARPPAAQQQPLQKTPQAPVQHRTPVANDTLTHWNPHPNPSQYHQPQPARQPRPVPAKEPINEYPKMVHAHTMQQPYSIRPQIPRHNEQMMNPINYSNIPDQTVANNQHHRFANPTSQMVAQQQQYQVEQERYRQMEYQKMTWGCQLGSFPNDYGGDYNMYNAGNQTHQ